MIREVLNRDFVLEQLREVQKELEAEVEEGRRSGGPRPEVDDHLTDDDFRHALEEIRAAGERERQASSGQEGFEPQAEDGRRGDEPATLDDYAFISHDPVVSNLQSALEEYFEEREDVQAAVPDGVRFECRGRFKSGVEWWGRFGFVTLDLDGDRITVRFHNEQGGEPDHQEVVT